MIISFGTSVHDATPRQIKVGTLDELSTFFDAHRAKDKSTAPYVCAGFEDGNRSRESVLPTRFIALDLDRIDPEVFDDLRLYLSRFRGLGWQTHSSKPDSPRFRAILTTDRDINRDESIRLGAVLIGDLVENFGDAIKADESVSRPEQPLFVPPIGAAISRFDGDPVDVDRCLAAAPKKTNGEGNHALDDDDARRVHEGGRNAALTRIAGKLRRAGLSATEIEGALLQVNRERCSPPLDEAEVRGIARSVGRYEAGEAPPAEPLDIFRRVAAPSLAAEDFPSALADFALPLARAAGHDPSAYLMAGLGAAAAAMGDDVRLMLDSTTSWFESPRLWVLLLGAPGTAKSPAIKAAMAPLFQLHRELRAEHARACSALAKDEPQPPQPAVFVSDATIEKLSEILADNPRGIVAVFEELDSWLGAHDCYRGGQGSKDRGEWLRLFDGGPHQVDRIKRGSYFVPNWGASILGATTPAGLRRHAKSLPPDGLIQRFLPLIVRPMVAPDATIHGAEVRRAGEVFADRLRELHAASGGVVKLSREAAEVFFARRDALREQIEAVEAFSEPFAGHVAKHAGLLGRIALTMHGIECGRAAPETALTGDTLQRADRLLRKLTRHALALFDMLASNDSTSALAQAVGRSIVAGGLPEVTRRDLRQHCRAFKSATEYQREAAIRLLIDAAWLTPITEGRQYDGRPSRLIVTPEVFERFRDAGEELKARRAKVREMFET